MPNFLPHMPTTHASSSGRLATLPCGIKSRACGMMVVVVVVVADEIGGGGAWAGMDKGHTYHVLRHLVPFLIHQVQARVMPQRLVRHGACIQSLCAVVAVARWWTGGRAGGRAREVRVVAVGGKEG